jgi:glycosyltransferase involved in cell wall biosynthesis
MLSAVIITYNEEQNIARCLQSLQDLADELIVVDSDSTDGTCAIAASMGAKVIRHTFEGYAAQKNFAASCAAGDWVLSVDADEVLTAGLRQSIADTLRAPAHNAYFLRRSTSFCGHFIRHGSWYPDKQCRLWNKTKGSWSGLIHETWRLHDPSGSYGTLRGDLLHYSFNSISDYLRMTDKYTTLSAREAYENGRNCSLFKLLAGPAFKFFQDYFLRLGFLDGYAGFVAYRLAAYGAFVKYSKIREKFKQQHQ